jgi:hypothetical protein
MTRRVYKTKEGIGKVWVEERTECFWVRPALESTSRLFHLLEKCPPRFHVPPPHTRRKCSCVSSAPHGSRRRSGELRGRKGFVAPKSEKLNRSRERRLVWRRGRVWMWGEKAAEGG